MYVTPDVTRKEQEIDYNLLPLLFAIYLNDFESYVSRP